MNITIGSYKLRLEYAIIIVFLIVVIFSHSMRASSYSGLLEGFAKKDSKGMPMIAGPSPMIASPAKEGFSNYKTNAGPQFAENDGNYTHLPLSQWSSVMNVPPQNANQPMSSDSMDFFKNTQFKPECCPNTYSGSEGCACMSNDQYNTLVSRGGNNVPYSEY